MSEILDHIDEILSLRQQLREGNRANAKLRAEIARLRALINDCPVCSELDKFARNAEGK